MSTAETFDIAGKKIWVTGHSGMVGSAIVRQLSGMPCTLVTPSHKEVDLTQQSAVERFMAAQKPQAVIMCAAKVGGILANSTLPGDFLYDNLAINLHVIEAAKNHKVEKLVYLGSSCIYPRLAPQPIKEEALLTGPLEPTNEWYALAKIAGIKLCQAYRIQHGCNFVSCMPTNLYGPGDHFDPLSSHVIPALIYKFHQAKIQKQSTVEIWGSGKPRREFLHVDDLAKAVVLLLARYAELDHINIGTGEDLTIQELARHIRTAVGHDCELVFDSSKPDGMPRKLLDVSKITGMGWKPTISLTDGLAETYQWYIRNIAS